ncbi:MAG: hypothetical protein PHH87_05780 [Desulfuromonas sp.]|nr:hypothetical protein [Desulfuromonas sp.]
MYVISKLFDYVLYPYVIYTIGIWTGGAFMTALSALVCLMFLKFYDHSQRDWLGIETLRDLKDFNGQQRGRRILSWMLQRSDPVAFMALSIFHDPFITTVWLRHERFGPLTPRDLRIFWGSVFVANLFWILSCWLGINLFQWVWNWL